MQNHSEEIKQQGVDTVVISGKVRRSVGEQVFRMMRRRGLTVNDFIQIVCETCIRYMSPDHNLTSEMERAMSLFEHMGGWEDAVLLSRPNTPLTVKRAVYYLGADGRKGFVPVMVDRPFFGEWTQTENVAEILDATLRMSMPERHARMKSLAESMGCGGIVEMLDRLIDEHTEEEELRAIRRDFEDCDRSDYGRKPVSEPFKRKPRRDMETMFKPLPFSEIPKTDTTNTLE